MPAPTTINRRAKIGLKAQKSSFQTVSLATTTLTPSFLTGQSATFKTTTARPTPSKQFRRTPPNRDVRRRPAGSGRSTLTGTKLPPNSMISAQSPDDATVVSDADNGIVTATPTKTVTTSSISSPSAERWVTPSLGRWRLLLGPSEGSSFRRLSTNHDHLARTGSEASSSGG